MLTKINSNENNNLDDSIEYQKDKRQNKKSKYHKKTGNKCYCLNILEHYGPIHIITKQECSKVYISKLKLVKFNDHFDELFEKGKFYDEEKELKDDNKLTIPVLTFWYQRYYYYSKYDEGIMMDNESK